MIEKAGNTLDASAVGIVIATLFGWLPNIAALLSVIWLAMRIYSTYLDIQKQRKGALDDK